MNCEIRNIISFKSLFLAKINPLEFLGLLIARMKLQLNDEGAALKHVKIRPWWFDDETEPEGLIVILLGEIA